MHGQRMACAVSIVVSFASLLATIVSGVALHRCKLAAPCTYANGSFGECPGSISRSAACSFTCEVDGETYRGRCDTGCLHVRPSHTWCLMERMRWCTNVTDGVIDAAEASECQALDTRLFAITFAWMVFTLVSLALWSTLLFADEHANNRSCWM